MGNWSQVAKFVSGQGQFPIDFALGVAISADTVVVTGAPTFFDSKAAYIYQKTALGWRNTLPIAALTYPTLQSPFYLQAAIDGDTIVLGGSGYAYVYVKPPGGWTNSTPLAATLAPSDTVDLAFGGSISIDGDTIVVGDSAANSNTGAAYVYQKPASGWANMTETAKLTASDGLPSDYFGQTVAISGSTIVAGAPQFFGNAGTVYLFTKPASGWSTMTQTAELTAPGSSELGLSVAVSGSTVVAGSLYSVSSGATAYVFAEPSSGWHNMGPTASLKPGDYKHPTAYASSVGISGNIVAVGASGRSNTNMGGVGGIYIFEKPRTGWQDYASTIVLTGSDARYFARLGYPLAIDGKVVVGAAFGGLYPGAAYAFMLP